MERKVGKTCIMIALLLISVALMANASIGKTSEIVHASNSFSTSPVSPPTEWNKTYGGGYAYSVVQTSDGGYALAGVYPGTARLVKTDAAGNMQWNQTYVEAGYVSVYSVVQTSDGGYALAGDIYFASVGTSFWLVKTDADGNEQWSQSYKPGEYSANAVSMVQTSDSGYAILGHTNAYGEGSPYRENFWLVKTNATGNMMWWQTYGGAEDDIPSSLVQTSDGGYALAGYTWSFGVVPHPSFWLVKTDADGNMQWQQTYGTGTDVATGYAHSVVQTSDGGYALAGANSYGCSQFIKTDADGNMQWQQTYGAAATSDILYSVVQTSDGGYALANDRLGLGGYDCALLIKTDAAGNVQWNQTYVKPYTAYCPRSVVQTSDGGYVLGGYSFYVGPGNAVFWLAKIAGGVWYGLTITSTTGGTTDPSPGTYPYGAGTVASVTAMPNANYLFDHWELDGAPAGTTNPINVTMDTNHGLHAFFIAHHDIAVTNVTPSKTVVGRGYSLNINVTAANQGDYTETFNVTVYANTTSVTSQTVTLSSGNSTTITLMWDTTGWAKGNYTISAVADTVPGETDTTDNTIINGWVLVTVPGDVNGDGECNILDIKRVKLALSGWIVEPNADLDNNGEINILDLKKVKLIYSGFIV